LVLQREVERRRKCCVSSWAALLPDAQAAARFTALRL
jgi:hypothetical protein